MLKARPPLAMAVGALAVSTSAVFIDLSGTSPPTATFFRCTLAVPLLLPLALHEHGRTDALHRRDVIYAVAAGVLFTGDALWWTQAIAEIGAGLSTVLVNAQVVLVPLLTLVFDREPISRRFLGVLPVMIVGILLTGGVLGASPAGDDPVGGTLHAVLAALCYSGFLYLLRRGGMRGSPVRGYAVVVATAAVVALAAGPLWGRLDLRPTIDQVGWLVLIAATGQVAGWLLVALAGPRLRPEVGAALLLLTPVGALVLGALVLGEQPSAGQMAGSVLVLAGAYVATARRS